MPLLETDPIDLELDDDNNLIIPMRHTYGLKGVAQGIKVRLLMVRGEWFLDLDIGMPYFEGEGIDPNIVIMGKPFNRDLTAGLIRERILRTPGVKAIEQLTVTFDGETRTVYVTYRVRVDWDDTLEDSLEVTP